MFFDSSINNEMKQRAFFGRGWVIIKQMLYPLFSTDTVMTKRS